MKKTLHDFLEAIVLIGGVMALFIFIIIGSQTNTGRGVSDSSARGTSQRTVQRTTAQTTAQTTTRCVFASDAETDAPQSLPDGGNVHTRSGGGDADEDDPYDARDYDNADDFYYDHFDDFYDFEDAEDYWEDSI